MKKTYLLMALICSMGSAYAQSQRLTIIEEFTQASCGPCAAQNPALNALLSTNTSKVVSIKYQTSWPGIDPMNAQNPSQTATRVSYYGVTGVPSIKYDGKTIGTGTNPTAPAHLSQAKIDAQYAVTSPFDFDLTHTVNANFDSIFITATITATQNVTITGSDALRLHLAVVEKEIIFDNAPGSNGEKEFYSVMRKMLPSDLGTALPSSWTIGQDEVVTIAAPIPSYIYDLNEVAVVGFIQDNNNKDIKQAAITEPIMVPNDAGVSVISNIPLFQCDASFTPSVTIKNYGADVLTSAVINYKLNSGTTSTQNWSGSIAPGGTAVVALPEITVTGEGTHTFNAFITMPNGVSDINQKNDSKSKPVKISFTGITTVDQKFTSSVFPPTGYFINNPDGGETWKRVVSSGSPGSPYTRMFFNASPVGQVDEFFLPALDLTTVSSPIMFDFNVACAQLTDDFGGRLEVLVSTDCGASWNSHYDASDSDLATVPNNNSTVFIPASVDDWRKESIDLSSYGAEDHLMIKFKATSNSGNSLYLDDMLLYSTTGIQENIADFKLNIFPNPANNTINIRYSIENNKNINIKVVDALGTIVYSKQANSTAAGEALTIDSSDFAPGIYFVQFSEGNKTEIKKITIIK